MGQRRVLLYGGCHALILRDLLATYFSDDVSCTLLINFALIRSGRPFPYETLGDFDVVLYSPVENKGAYNTSYLVEACRSLGIDAVCYPWLEWHGYCPGASKAEFKHRFHWRYADLAEAASSFASFDDYVDWAVESYPSNATIDTCFATTTTMLQAAEERHDMSVRVSNFICENYRNSRLFLISDHPSLVLYVHVLSQMLTTMGISGAIRCEQILRDEAEPQGRWRTPIFPRVAKQLDLRFSDTIWVDDEMVPERRLDLRSYLLLYYYTDSVVLGPLREDAVVGLPTFEMGDRASVSRDSRLLANPVRRHPQSSGDKYRLIEMLSGTTIPTIHNEYFTIMSEHWTNSWG